MKIFDYITDMAYPLLLAEAKRLKRLARPSVAESLFMSTINWMLLYGYGFHREWRIPTSSTPFYVDFAQPFIRLAVEIDGQAYHQDVVRDFERDEYLRSKGWVVVRFTYHQLHDSPHGVRRELWENFNKLNTPLRKREVAYKTEQEKKKRAYKNSSLVLRKKR